MEKEISEKSDQKKVLNDIKSELESKSKKLNIDFSKESENFTKESLKKFSSNILDVHKIYTFKGTYS